MPKESNYFEEAYRLCQDADPLVSHTCKSLYDNMIKSRVNNNLLPLGDFNILYFFQSTIQVLIKQFPGVALAPSVFPCHVEPINGCNWPDESQVQKFTIQGGSSLIAHYMEMVSEDSTPCGDNFDVNYACMIMIATFNNAIGGVLGAWKGLSTDFLEEQNTVDFDYWLSGFNSQ